MRESAGSSAHVDAFVHTLITNREKNKQTNKRKRRARRKQKGARGHLSVTNLLLVLVGGRGGISSSADLHPCRSAASALSSKPEQQQRAGSSRSRQQPRGGCARVCGVNPGKPRGPHPPLLLARFRDARLRLSARRDGTPSLLATCCHSNPPGGSRRRLLPTEVHKHRHSRRKVVGKIHLLRF